jgi:L-cysteine desulfidase
MGVTIPGTTVNGVALAAAIGALAAMPIRDYRRWKILLRSMWNMAQALIAAGAVDIDVEDTPDFIHLDLTLSAGDQTCRVVVKGTHTNVVEFILMANSSHYTPGKIAPQRRPNCQLSLQEAYDFIISTPVKNITFILEAARLNSALAAEGKSKKYGLNINGTFSEAVKNGLMSND